MFAVFHEEFLQEQGALRTWTFGRPQPVADVERQIPGDAQDEEEDGEEESIAIDQASRRIDAAPLVVEGLTHSERDPWNGERKGWIISERPNEIGAK